MEKLNSLLDLKSEKNRIIISNVSISFVIKGINVLIGFLTIPLILSFLNSTKYGVWLTLMSVLSWFSLFDLGFGNGLRNNLTIEIEKGDYREAKIFISTTYAALSAIFGFLIVAFLIVNPLINWNLLFNASNSIRIDLEYAVLISICSLFVQFVSKLIQSVLFSLHKTALVDFTNVVVQIIIFIGLYCLKAFHFTSLTAVALVYSLTPIVIFFVATIYIFYRAYSNLRPHYSFVKIGYVNKMLKLGMDFFIIQIAGLILYASDNFIIAHFFEPSDVTVYNIAFKYFSLGNIILSVVLTPFWSMIIKANLEGDFAWIKQSVTKLLLFAGLLALFAIVQFFIANKLISIWVGNKIVVPYSLLLTMLIYFIFTNWGNIFTIFLNGFGKIKLQLYVAIFCMCINIPLAIIFIQYYGLGIIGVPLATILTMFFGNVLSTFQFGKIVNRTAVGIWNK